MDCVWSQYWMHSGRAVEAGSSSPTQSSVPFTRVQPPNPNDSTVSAMATVFRRVDMNISGAVGNINQDGLEGIAYRGAPWNQPGGVVSRRRTASGRSLPPQSTLAYGRAQRSSGRQGDR